jgi:dethiobiotin synthetase
MKRKAIFVAATGQNVGKTTICLGLVSGLQKRFASVGFLKPVGQESVQSHTGVPIDKDVLLFKSRFGLKDS